MNGELDQALTFSLQAVGVREAAGFRPLLSFDHLLPSTAYQAREDADRALLLARIAASLATALESSRARALADARLRQGERLWREQQKASHPFEHPSAQG